MLEKKVYLVLHHWKYIHWCRFRKTGKIGCRILRVDRYKKNFKHAKIKICINDELNIKVRFTQSHRFKIRGTWTTSVWVDDINKHKNFFSNIRTHFCDIFFKFKSPIFNFSILIDISNPEGNYWNSSKKKDCLMHTGS